MSNCSKHTKEVAGISDMKILAEMVGDLHYETLADFLEKLCEKFILDSAKDRAAGRNELAKVLHCAGCETYHASISIEQAWKISKPFMNKNETNE